MMVMDEVIVIVSTPDTLTAMPWCGSAIPGKVTSASIPASIREVASVPISADVSTGYSTSGKASTAHAANVSAAHTAKVRAAHAAKVRAAHAANVSAA